MCTRYHIDNFPMDTWFHVGFIYERNVHTLSISMHFKITHTLKMCGYCLCRNKKINKWWSLFSIFPQPKMCSSICFHQSHQCIPPLMHPSLFYEIRTHHKFYWFFHQIGVVDTKINFVDGSIKDKCLLSQLRTKPIISFQINHILWY